MVINYVRGIDANDAIKKNYTPVTVKELKDAGFEIEGFNPRDIVYLDSEGYKTFMSAVDSYPNDINNVVQTNGSRRR